MDALLDLVRTRKWVSIKSWLVGPRKMELDRRRRRIALELFKIWKKSLDSGVAEYETVINSLNEVCRVIFVKKLSYKQVSLAVNDEQLGDKENVTPADSKTLKKSKKSILVLYEQWSTKPDWNKIKDNFANVSMFNSLLLTMPLMTHINKTVSEARCTDVTFWSLVEHKRIPRGYTELKTSNDDMLSSVLKRSGKTEAQVAAAMQAYRQDIVFVSGAAAAAQAARHYGGDDDDIALIAGEAAGKAVFDHRGDLTTAIEAAEATATELSESEQLSEALKRNIQAQVERLPRFNHSESDSDYARAIEIGKEIGRQSRPWKDAAEMAYREQERDPKAARYAAGRAAAAAAVEAAKRNGSEFDINAIQRPDHRISVLVDIFDGLGCSKHVKRISHFDNAIKFINKGKDLKSPEALDKLLRKLPRISVFDPANLYIGARIGDIVEIQRDDAIHNADNHRTPMYRFVTDSDDLIDELNDMEDAEIQSDQ